MPLWIDPDELPSIRSLDLRDPARIEADERYWQEQERLRAYDRLWDWPVFPSRVARFLDGEPFPAWSIAVAIESAHRMGAKVYQFVGNPFTPAKSRRYKPMKGWHWARICLTLGCMLAFAVCVYVETLAVWAWL